jgi:tetratricopeptide (TPR) repeat protein
MEPTYHERLASAHATRAPTTGDRGDVASALAHYRRAILAAPENARLHLALFQFALSRRPTLLDVALGAAREAIARDPGALDQVLDQAVALPLADEQWLVLVPASAAVRLRLALGLDTRALLGPAAHVARAALGGPVAKGEAGAGRWLLARLLILRGNVDGAVEEIALARSQDPGNPELALTHADALRARGDPRALDAYRAAVDAAPGSDGDTAGAPRDPFPVSDVRLRDAIRARVGASPLRHRKALASYLGIRGFREQSMREWRAIVDADGRDAHARFALALALEALGQGDQALEEYRRAVALDGRSAYRGPLARRLWESQHYFQAIAEWRTIRDREPQNLEARLALARAFVKVGDRGAALQEYQTIVRLDPGNTSVRDELEAARRAPR